MNKKAKAKEIEQILNQLYPDPAIPLEHKDPYTLLIAVLLSAQCTDKKVNQITPILFRLADNPLKMCSFEIDAIEAVIRPCGLSRTKAKNIWSLSKILLENYEGQVPTTFHELESLPGVGHKTASVVLCQAFGIPAFPVDTHIHRCAHRWGLSSGKNVEKTEEDLKKLFPKKIWNKLHLQMIYFAREFCPAKKHQPEKCPICSVI